jgi:hypothetical protein
MARSRSTAIEDLTTDLKLTRYPRSLAAAVAAFPSVSLFLQLGSLITRMVHEEMLPTKHTKHANEAESACKAFVPFVCLVGKALIQTHNTGNRCPTKYLRKTRGF